MPNRYDRRAARGAAWLDTVKPGWRDDVDPGRLNLRHGRDCVLGQAFSREAPWSDGFTYAVDHWKLGPLWGLNHGFLTNPLSTRAHMRQRAAWKHIIHPPAQRQRELDDAAIREAILSAH